jgi:hypothetical protein
MAQKEIIDHNVIMNQFSLVGKNATDKAEA